MDSSSSWWYISLVVFLCMSFSLLPDTTHLHHSRQSVERQKVGPQKFVLNRNMQLLVLFFFLYCRKTVRMPFSIYHAKEKLVRLASSGYLIQHNTQFLLRFTLTHILMYLLLCSNLKDVLFELLSRLHRKMLYIISFIYLKQKLIIRATQFVSIQRNQ